MPTSALTVILTFLQIYFEGTVHFGANSETGLVQMYWSSHSQKAAGKGIVRLNRLQAGP